MAVVNELLIAIVGAAFVAVIGMRIAHGKHAAKSDSDLLTAEARAAYLLTQITEILSQQGQEDRK